MEEKNSSRMYAAQEPDGSELDPFVSEEDIDSAAIAHVPSTHTKVAQHEDQFETRRRAFFGIE
jgi:hypothetical protein